MANTSYIKIGSVLVPVISTVDLTGTNPAYRPTVDLPAIAAECFYEGVFVGYGHNGKYPDGIIYTECNIQGGRTGMHDVSGELIIEITSANPTLFIDNNTYSIQATVVNDSTQYYQTSRFEFIKTANALLLDKYRDYNTRLVAVRYHYPNATTDPLKQYGYKVFALAEIEETNTSSGTVTRSYNTYGSFYIDIPYLNRVRGTNLYIEEQEQPQPEDDPFDPSDPDPYDPDQDDTSDLIDIPTDPTIGISNAGWVHVYNPTTGGLVNFGAWLFPNPELPSTADPTDIVNYLLLLCQTLANSRLIDYILDCHIIPVSPQVTTSQDIKVGGRTATGISAPVVASDYITVSCGSLNIQEYFGGFQDFLLTKSHLYLPFVGFVDVLPEYWQSGTISVDYKFNVIDGSFMAYVRSASHRSQLAGSVIAQYSGNACMHIPITGINYANMVSGLVGAAVAAQGAQGASAVLGQAYSAANTILSGGNMIQSNGYNATAAMLGVRYPYLVIERPVPSYPSKYGHSKGFPSNIYAALSSITGYTIIDDIDLSGIPLMEVELNELRTLLKEGVYF